MTVWQSPICTDDFGEAVYHCRYTKELVWSGVAVVIGATIPGLDVRYVLAPTQQAKEAHKASTLAFHESEANCNTCKDLLRVKHKKNAANLLYGECRSTQPHLEDSPYCGRKEGEVMVFHPNDPMHMRCYTQRT